MLDDYFTSSNQVFTEFHHVEILNFSGEELIDYCTINVHYQKQETMRGTYIVTLHRESRSAAAPCLTQRAY